MFNLSLADIEKIDFGVVTTVTAHFIGWFNVKWIGAASGTEMTHFFDAFFGQMWQRFIICVAVCICKYVSVYHFSTFKLDF